MQHSIEKVPASQVKTATFYYFQFVIELARGGLLQTQEANGRDQARHLLAEAVRRMRKLRYTVLREKGQGGLPQFYMARHDVGAMVARIALIYRIETTDGRILDGEVSL